MRRSVSEAALAQPEDPLGTDPLKSLTLHDLSLKGSSERSNTPELSLSTETLGPSTPSDVNFLLGPEDAREEVEGQDEMSTRDGGHSVGAAFPEGFHPRRSSQGPTRMPLYSSPIAKNPFMSPLLASDSMLQSLPPVHIVVSTRWGQCTPKNWGGLGADSLEEESSWEGGGKKGQWTDLRGEVCQQEQCLNSRMKGVRPAIFFRNLELHGTMEQQQGLESQGKGKEKRWSLAGGRTQAEAREPI